jgi:sugar lactone lactonase YvrE
MMPDTIWNSKAIIKVGNMVMYEPELLSDMRAILGEGPCWDEEKKLLSWIDILGQRLHIIDPNSKINRTVILDQNVGAAVPTKAGEYVLALATGFYSLEPMTELLVPIDNPEAHLPNQTFNDGKCDVAGRFWAGTMELNEAEGAGSLVKAIGFSTTKQ